MIPATLHGLGVLSIPTIGLLTVFALAAPGKQAPAQPAASDQPQPVKWTAAEDHRNMMEQLGIKALRPGANGNEKAPDHANYDESKANPFPDWPDALVLNSGKKVTSANAWWKQRRPEIVEDFEREVVGRIPRDVPKVTWSVASTTNSMSGSIPVIEKQLVGHVDNSACPSITVDIQVTLFTPAHATGPVPVMIMFASQAFMKRMAEMMAKNPEMKERMKAMLGNDPPAAEQLIADGWGYALLDPGSVQPDNGAGLTRGIIGLVNKGPGAQARRLGRAAGLGLGRVTRSGLSRNRQSGEREAGGHRGRLALR